MGFAELKRAYKIIKVMLEYGLDDFLFEPQLKQTRALSNLKLLRKSLFFIKNKHANLPLGERLRLALQDLGPVWIKFGQMMSTRRDLFSEHIADPLALLQDKVVPFDGHLAKEQIELALGYEIKERFVDFDLTPLASASIAQVHTARLKDSGQDVVLKVIRPDIYQIIYDDLSLINDLSKIIANLIGENSKRLKPVEVVHEYEKTLLNELDLRLETANAIALRNNFLDSNELYVPEVYPEFSRSNLMISERIYGISISNIDALVANGTNMKLLAERGVNVFFTQVFRDSFFHADMHAGNVFVKTEHPHDPTWIGLDCGIVGVLDEDDKNYLAKILLAFFNRNYFGIAQLHLDSGWVPEYVNVKEFEQAIRTVCEPIFAKPLGEISFGHVLFNLLNTARKFDMSVQPQLVLLQKTLLYIEGLGRQLYPSLDLWATAKPFLENWMSEQIGLIAFVKSVKKNAPILQEILPQLPRLLYDNAIQNKRLHTKIDKLQQSYIENQQKSIIDRYFFGIGATFVVSSAILLSGENEQASLISFTVGVIFWIIRAKSQLNK